MTSRLKPMLLSGLLIVFWLVWTGNCLAGQDMVLVEGGTFIMGDKFNLVRRDADGPEHQVTLPSYYMSKYTVTFFEYDEFCAATGRPKPSDNQWGRGRRPVINVTWYDAVEYCNWLSREEGLTPAYQGSGDDIVCDFSANGYRLPTEAEYEYAARGGSLPGKRYSNPGDTIWFGGETTQPVGLLKPNNLGLYDMIGNVYQWCWDRYGAYGTDAVDNPTGPPIGEYRCTRGGSAMQWIRLMGPCARSAKKPDDSYYALGFRLVRSGR